jgi:hypothetical protein
MPENTLPPTAKIASIAFFEAARMAMMAAYGEATRHMGPLEAAIEAERTLSAMKRLAAVQHG